MSECETCNGGSLIKIDGNAVDTTQGVTNLATSTGNLNVASNDGKLIQECAPTISSVTEETLPSVGHLIFAESQPACPTIVEPVEACENEKYGKLEPVEEKAKDVKPTMLDWIWQCALPTSKMTLLGRVKNKLAKFNKNGWLKVYASGVVEVVEELELFSTRLLHIYSKPNLNTPALLGDPINPAFYTVGVLNEAQDRIKFYPQRGLSDSDSIQVWNSTTNVVEHRAVSDFPVCFRSSLPELESGEILAIPKVCEGGDYTTKRSPHKLTATGLLFGKQVASAVKEGCEGVNDDTVVYSGIDLPTSDGCYIMTVNGCEVSFDTLDTKIKDVDITAQVKTILEDCIEELELKPETFTEWYNRTKGTNYSDAEVCEAMLVSAPRSSCKDCVEVEEEEEDTETP